MNGENLISAFRKISLRIRSRNKIFLDDDDAEDALQDAFCRLWLQRDKISGKKHAEGLLSVTSRNIRIDNARRRQAHPKNSIDDAGDIAAPQSKDEEVLDIYNTIDRLASQILSQRDREILYKREKDGWEFSDLADHYGLSESNVRLIISRARKNLRSLYLNNKHNG